MVNIVINHDKCDLCGLCIGYCPTYVFSLKGNRVVADNNKCIECYACIPLCPRNAISIENVDP